MQGGAVDSTSMEVISVSRNMFGYLYEVMRSTKLTFALQRMTPHLNIDSDDNLVPYD